MDPDIFDIISNNLNTEIIIKEEVISDSEDEDHVEYETVDYNEETPKSHTFSGRENGTIGHSGGTIGASTMRELFKCFIPPEMVDIITEYTNQKGNDYFKGKTWINTDREEIYAYLGLSLIIGALKARKEPLNHLWTNDPCFRRSIFQGTFSRTRFQQLSSVLRFDDVNTRQERKSTDKLAPIRQIFDWFVENCGRNYNPDTNLTLGDELLPFRGSCPFRVFTSEKRGRYGIKLAVLIDSYSGYCSNLHVHLGKSTREEQHESCLTMLQKLQNHCITNQCYVDVEFAKELLSRNITSIAEVKKRKELILKQFPKSEEPVDGVALITCNIQKKNLLLLSTVPSREVAISTYSLTKDSVDIFDKLISEYCTAKQTKAWTKLLFMHLLDVAASNSFIIWMEKNPQWQMNQCDIRRRFLLDLGKELIQDHAVRRFQTATGLQRPVMQAIGTIVGESRSKKRLAGDQPRKSKVRCFYCPRKKDRKTHTACETCGNLVCKEHCVISVKCHECRS